MGHRRRRSAWHLRDLDGRPRADGLPGGFDYQADAIIPFALTGRLAGRCTLLQRMDTRP